MNRNLMVIVGFVSILLISGLAGANQLEQSAFSLEQQKIRYDFSYQGDISQFPNTYEDDFTDNSTGGKNPPGYKSPAKAFLMSFAIPGLGQYYTGSKIKALAFAGLEVAGWIVRGNFISNGDDMTAAFEAFNREHWDRTRYEDYLEYHFDTRSDLDIDTSNYISHHLPSTLTQQYYEMTGKYDQFAWGWEDARINGLDIDSLIALGQLPLGDPLVDGTVPYSPNRFVYEQMRYDSNQEYKKGRRIASLILVNHLIAGFEAFIAAKRHNRNNAGSGGSQWSMKAGLKSYYVLKDTPYFKLSYKF